MALVKTKKINVNHIIEYINIIEGTGENYKYSMTQKETKERNTVSLCLRQVGTG